MEVIILAGGMGTRLKSVIDDVPKPMAPVGGKPFLEYIIHELALQGLNSIILSVGYKKEIIRSYFGNGSRLGVNIVYSVEEIPLGTGGAVREAMNIADSPHCLILNGDTFSQLDFLEMECFHVSNDCLATIGLMYKKNARRYGSVKINQRYEITDFQDKNKLEAGYVNCGAYIMDKEIINRMPTNRFSLENELLPKLIGSGVLGFITAGAFIDIGIPSAYRYINDHCYLLQDYIPNKTFRGLIKIDKKNNNIKEG